METHSNLTYNDLNAMLNILDESGKIQFDKDKQAVKKFFLDHVNQNTVFFHNLEEKLKYLVDNQYYESAFLEKYDFQFIKNLYKKAYDYKFRFPTFLGALKYYKSYTLKTFDGQRYLERFEDRVVAVALYLADGDKKLAESIIDEIISGRFQPATPTFLNAGKKQRGELVSCFLVRTEDNMESIARTINASLQLSKRGGGVSILLTNLRERGAPIKQIEGQSSGVVPIMKQLEDAFSYANQLGARDGAGAVYLHAHHPDIMEFLDTKRENADEKIRIKTLSLGVVIPDITFELAKNDDDMYLFSPYDVQNVYGVSMADISITEKYQEMVENHAIRKRKIKARKFFETLAQIQFESGYPYIMFEDNVNKVGLVYDGRVNMSNLCVAPETELLTDKGNIQIRTIKNETVNAWNGMEWSKITVKQTSTNSKLIRITLEHRRDSGNTIKYLDCTEYHKFYLENGKKIEAINLIPGMYLELPNIPGLQTAEDEVINEICVISVEDLGRYDETYCAEEPTRGKLIFNGILTGNCSEILQCNTKSEYREDLSYKKVGRDISCNLGSLNIVKTMESSDFSKTIETAIRSLSSVSDKSHLVCVPSIQEGNSKTHAIGLGQMNLHGYFAKNKMHYGDEESLDFTNVYFYSVMYNCILASNKLAKETKIKYDGFENSKYADGTFFDEYIQMPVKPKTRKVSKLFTNIHIPTSEDWQELKKSVMKYGIYNKYLQAIPPTGSISYINNSTSSVHPVAAKIEVRKEGSVGRVYYPSPEMTQDNIEFYKDAYEIGWEKIIDVYATAQKYVDQGMSLTLFFSGNATTREINRAQIYAWKKGIKTLYYIRTRREALKGTEVKECVACAL